MCLCIFETEVASRSLLVLGALGTWNVIAWASRDHNPVGVRNADRAVHTVLHAALALLIAGEPFASFKDAVIAALVAAWLSRGWWLSALEAGERPGKLACTVVGATWAVLIVRAFGIATVPLLACAALSALLPHSDTD